MKPASTKPTALVLIDIQHGLLPLNQSTPNFEANIETLIRAAREYNDRSPAQPILIIHVHHHSRSMAFPLHPSNKLPSGVRGVEALDCSKPLSSEPVLVKHWNSAFVGTDLEARLRAFGAKQLILAGLTTDHCVSTTARFAANLQVLGDEGGPDGSGEGHNGIIMLKDGTATVGKGGFDAKTLHEAHLASLEEEFVQIRGTEEAVNAIMR